MCLTFCFLAQACFNWAMSIESGFGKVRKIVAAAMMGAAAASGADQVAAQAPPSGEQLVEGRFFWRFNNENRTKFANTNSVEMTVAAHGSDTRTILVDDDKGRRIGSIQIAWPIEESSYDDFRAKMEGLLRSRGYLSR